MTANPIHEMNNKEKLHLGGERRPSAGLFLGPLYGEIIG